MKQPPNASLSRHIRFKIEASRCNLRIGDQVSPQTEVGMDHESGEMITAGCHGRVAGVTFSAGEHVLIVVIETIPQFEMPAE